MKYTKIKLGIVGVLGSMPMIAFADGELISFLGKVSEAFKILVPIMVTLALIYFIYGLAEYILVSGNEAKKAEGKNIMIYGTIAMFCIISIWGIVQFIGTTIGITTDASIKAPKIPN